MTVRFQVGETLVARVAAERASRVAGVLALRPSLRSLISRTAPDGVTASVIDGTAEVSVTVAVRLGYRCADLAVAVQQAVADAVAAHTGLPTTVSVTIAEVRAR